LARGVPRNLTQLEGLHRSAYLVVYFVLSAAEAFIEAVIVQRITINGMQLVLATRTTSPGGRSS
jgi:hypothetical protein